MNVRPGIAGVKRRREARAAAHELTVREATEGRPACVGSRAVRVLAGDRRPDAARPRDPRPTGRARPWFAAIPDARPGCPGGRGGNWSRTWARPPARLPVTVSSSRDPRPARTASSAIVSATYGVSHAVRSTVPPGLPTPGTMRAQMRVGDSAPCDSASQRAPIRRSVARTRSPKLRMPSRMSCGTSIANAASSAIASSTRSSESAARSSRRDTSETRLLHLDAEMVGDQATHGQFYRRTHLSAGRTGAPCPPASRSPQRGWRRRGSRGRPALRGQRLPDHGDSATASQPSTPPDVARTR